MSVFLHQHYGYGTGQLRLAGCVWPVASGDRLRLANCVWPIASGQLRLAGCVWPVASGDRLRLANCVWPIASGQLRLASCVLFILDNITKLLASVEGWQFGIAQDRGAEEVDAGREVDEAADDDDDDYSPFVGDANFLPALWKPIFGARQFTLETFCTLHLEVMEHRNTRAGTLRDCEMTVGNFHPMPPDEVPGPMQQFVAWFNHELASASSSAAEFAARAQHTLVYIHPFYDGNGRTSRLLMNLIMLRCGYHPVILPEKKRDEYYKWLEEASNNNIEPFIKFISFHQQCAQDLEPAPPPLPSSS
ncbi:hypothetical protein niasHS_006264 [Heterodera schachtii]|uniref:Fido domain-containing protein n=1 Tax=Heterodera schachtii TaxID=97005 RepID=A0ABD2JSU3_HETSC